MALHEGYLAEMATGEGKTLVATLPLYLRALEKDRQGAHLVTVNDYLARRDAENLGPLYEYLGVSLGVVQGSSTNRERRKAYQKDITYVTNNELGFDYLRDHLAFEVEELTVTAPRDDDENKKKGLERRRDFYTPLPFGIVDEADSILVDEARTPLIISAPADMSLQELEVKYRAATDVAKYLKRGEDYEVDKKAKRCFLNGEGANKTLALLGVDSLFDKSSRWMAFIQPALNAKEHYIRERDYILNGRGEVVIVDEFTGRIMEGRRWNGGLHQAIEAKENTRIRPEQVTAASITYQSLFNLYKTLAGMTGTAKTEELELKGTYAGMEVIKIPTAKPVRRDDRDDLVFNSKLAKFRAAIRMILEYHEEGRPVLVGTTTVEDSSLISELLANEKVPHRVLNAKPQVAQRESEIIAQAGRVGAVTIATNMAGRGTDILLGGNAALFARIAARQALAPLVDDNLRPIVEFEQKKGKAAKVFPVDPSEAAMTALLEAAKVSSEDLRTELFEMELEAQALKDQQDEADFGDSQQQYKTNESLVMNAADERTRLFARLSHVDEYVAAAAAAASQGKFEEKPTQAAFGKAVLAIEEEFQKEVAEERAVVRELGGLVVLGTERHESRRIDQQLRGRAGRQGDSGESVFVISLEDKMFNVFGADKMAQLKGAFEFAGDLDEPLSSNLLTNSLSTIQKKVESYYKEIREQLFKYDSIVNAQRRKFYSRRQDVLLSNRADLENLMTQYCVDTTKDVLANVTLTLKNQYIQGSKNPLAQFNYLDKLDALELAQAATAQVQLLFPRAASLVDQSVMEMLKATDGKVMNMGDLEDALTGAIKTAVQLQLEEIDRKDTTNTNLGEAVTRFLIVREFDRGWKQHLQAVQLYKETAGLQSFAQKDPFAHFTQESNEAYQKLSADIYRFSAIAFLTLDPETNLVSQEPKQDMTLGESDDIIDINAPLDPMGMPVRGGPPPPGDGVPLSKHERQHQVQAQGNRAARRAAKKGKKTRRVA